MQAAQIARQEFEYIRHGKVNFASALSVYDGQMRGWCLDKSAEHLLALLEKLSDQFKAARKIHLEGQVMSANSLKRGYRSWVRVLLDQLMLLGSIERNCCCGRSPTAI